MRRDFLIGVILGLLQLPPVSEENNLIKVIVRQIDFRSLDDKTQRTQWANQLLQPFVRLRVPSAIAASIVTSGITTTRVTSARVTSTRISPTGVTPTARVASAGIPSTIPAPSVVASVRASRVLNFRARVVAFIAI